MKKEDIAVKMILSGWHNGQETIQKTLAILSDENMDIQLSPGKNKVSWIVGHLAAVNDSLFTILGLGEKVNESYYDYFINAGSQVNAPNISQIRMYWKETSEKLTEAMLSVDNWYEKHTTVSAEDFAKEPHRNRLNVLLTRSYHTFHHYGQLSLILKSLPNNK